MADRTVSKPMRLGPLVGTVVALVLGVLSLSALAVQVEVADSDVAATRACGSAFDALADRAGWETWWAGDLDEPDDATRAALVRTTGCPDAVNTRIVLAAVLGTGAVLAALAVLARRRVRRGTRTAGRGRGRLDRLGRITSLVGAILTVAGVVAVVLLVADADSTLFLYTDRFVVAVVGLIVLVPTISLLVIGRVVTILADTDRGGPDPTRTDADRTDTDRAETDAS